MEGVLVAILGSVIEGNSIGAALAAITTDQWLTFAAGAAADLAPELAKHLGLSTKGNSLGALIDGVVKVASDELTKKAVRDWFAANANAAMRLQPGMGTDY